MAADLTVVLPDSQVKQVETGKTLLELSKEFQSYYKTPIVAAEINNRLRELSFMPGETGEIKFLDLTHGEGRRIYKRTLTFLLVMAVKEVFPETIVSVKYSMGRGVYCELGPEHVLTEEDVVALENKMWELAAQDIPIKKEQWSLEKAISHFEREGLTEKAQLLRYRRKSYLNIYSGGQLSNYLFGYLAPSTGCLQVFGLRYHMPGFILEYPDDQDPRQLPTSVERPKLFTIFRESDRWGQILNVTSVADLNDCIMAGGGEELLRLNEALHEKKIAQIADDICSRKDQVRVILIAGPSSSGKTTFAERLAIQLKVNGAQPISISLDDYFVNREFTPIGDDGKPDFEALEAIDLELFNKQLNAIIRGQKVNLPSFNFKLGAREYLGNEVQIGPDQPIIIEGIHGLNDRLTAAIPRELKYKIYISAITTLNIDRHNRIPTNDVRILRRIVRDSQFRGHDAATTIRMWPKVRLGEERNIFPYQEEVDIMFNSAFVCELAMIKPLAEPLLQEIVPEFPEFVTANRLLKFLECFVPLRNVSVPCTSILNEFLGGSCLVL